MAKRRGKIGATALLLAGLWLGLAGSRALALTVASRAGALKRLHAGALRLKASSNKNADVERTTDEAKASLDQDWLQKTAEEIRQFGVEEVSFWVRAALEAENYAHKVQEITEILKSEDVMGTALLKLTYERLVAEPYKIAAGPAGNLAERIAAVSAPPAASGFQDDLDATEFIQELAAATPEDLGEGVQVFNLTKTLPVEPYDQSGPKLLTRNTTRRAWQATFKLMKGGRIKRVAMLGVPGIGKSRNLALGLWHGVTDKELEGIEQPKAIVYEAREGRAVFLFTKDSDGEWKAQSLPWSQWAADSCQYLKEPNNWYLVDASEETTTTGKFAAKTWLACSPDSQHYSNFIKGAGCCVFIESWSKSELQVALGHIEASADMLSRYDKIGGNLRALLSAEPYFNKYVKDQQSEANDWQHLQPAFSGRLDNQDKKLLTRLFTYISKDALEYEVDFCCAGAASLVANAHYEKLVNLWSKPDEPARYWFQKFVGPLLTFSWFQKKFAAWTITNVGSADRATWQRDRCDDLMIAENLQLVECDSTAIFEERWQKALQEGTLAQQVLSSPPNYPGIDYLLEFNHGIQVTKSATHSIAKEFREKLADIFNSAGGSYSFTLTFLITGDPEKFTPKGDDFNALMKMAEEGKLFDNICVQVVQIPKTLNSLS